ncbi:hypothetical protein BD311DRAFT_678788 [Dichomitus squalens]|uniref:Uncharacterized protein n=1 Tax=Dichomitus squalens TaxID=114155 RepID=A0A4Q9M4T9_9APHY|nr:hypothetical protein BD311DRAFT_678788 [Dichomitus squalens]
MTPPSLASNESYASIFQDNSLIGGPLDVVSAILANTTTLTFQIEGKRVLVDPHVFVSHRLAEQPWGRHGARRERRRGHVLKSHPVAFYQGISTNSLSYTLRIGFLSLMSSDAEEELERAVDEAQENGMVSKRDEPGGAVPAEKNGLHLHLLDAFTDEIARLGKWNGKASEGFVGRTHFSVPPTSRGKPARSRPTPGVVVFLKVKVPGAANVPKSKLSPGYEDVRRVLCGEITRDKSQHRNQFREAAQKFNPPTRLLALEWSFDIPLSTVHRS